MTFEASEGTTVFIQPAYELGMARLRALVAGAPDEFKEGFQLDAKMSNQVPKNMIGRLLTLQEGQALLKKQEICVVPPRSTRAKDTGSGPRSGIHSTLTGGACSDYPP